MVLFLFYFFCCCYEILCSAKCKIGEHKCVMVLVVPTHIATGTVIVECRILYVFNVYTAMAWKC